MRFKHLTQVNEPNPAGGADYVTTYQYTILDQVKLVTMPRPTGLGTVTQTRTFTYTGLNLSTATQPEIGLKQYFYTGTRLDYTIDAKNQRIDYAYDTYGRLSTKTPKNSGGTVVACDVYTYTYDTTANTYGSRLPNGAIPTPQFVLRAKCGKNTLTPPWAKSLRRPRKSPGW